MCLIMSYARDAWKTLSLGSGRAPCKSGLNCVLGYTSDLAGQTKPGFVTRQWGEGLGQTDIGYRCLGVVGGASGGMHN